MPRLIPASELCSTDKTAAAISIGKRAAHVAVNTELAKVAGRILAGHVDDDQEFEKVAALMVQTGALSQQDYLLEKEAKWGGMRSLFTRARGAMGGLKKRVGGLFNRGGKPGFDRGKAAKGWASGSKKLPKEVADVAGTKGKAKKPAWKFPVGKALLGAGALGTVYAGSKLIPAGARAIEATSTTPMAHGLGWSPVAYGYGHTPYGSGMATMGAGA